MYIATLKFLVAGMSRGSTLTFGSRGYDIELSMSVSHSPKHTKLEQNTNTNKVPSLPSKHSQTLPLRTTVSCLGPPLLSAP